MSFTKITNTQLNSRGATILPNQPTISATALKEEFDAPAKQIVAPAVNNLIDELQAVTSAANLGAVAPTGRTGATVQALLTDISDDLATVETNSHTHTNKTYIDKISEDGSGNPLYDGNPIGGGGASDTFKNIVSAGTTFTASGDNDTFKINAGSNVTITALSSPDKGIQISATGGGSSTGDMLMNDYDRSGDVKAASSSGNGIKDYVAGEIGKLDVSDSAVSGQYVSAVSETDGKISVTRTNLPTIPTVVNTYSSSGTDAISGTGVAAALGTLDVSDTAVSGQYVSAVSETDGKISVTRASLPTIPTVDQTYSSSSTNAQSGTAVAGAISTKANTSDLDEWTSASQVQSDGTVTFTGLNDNYGYDIFAEDILASVSQMTKTGSGTNVTLVYKTDAPVGTSCKLRILK